MSPLKVLVVDDEEGIRMAAGRWLRRAGYDVDEAEDGAVALSLLQTRSYHIVLCDVRMPELDGNALLDRIQADSLANVVIMMSAFGDADDALAAIRRGAYDYLPKPFKRDALLLMIAKVEERERLLRENNTLRETLRQDAAFENIVAQSDVMHSVFRVIRKIAEFKSTVLVTGESGTGKELVARAIHCRSNRASKPFVAVNCGAIPETLLESELFGHVRGAFTDANKARAGLFEEADGGTLLLDEIGTLPLALQVKLLRVLQEGELRRLGENKPRTVDVRVIAAGIDDLSELVDRGEFREDLYYRLNVIPIRLPPLRERPGDIPLLVEHALLRFNKLLGTGVKGFSPDAMQALCDYHWPGNVRQLQNVVERALVLSEGDRVQLQDLSSKLQRAQAPQPERAADGVPLVAPGEFSIKAATHRIEHYLISAALKETEGNRTHAAKLLEISHRALLYKIKNYGLQDVK